MSKITKKVKLMQVYNSITPIREILSQSMDYKTSLKFVKLKRSLNDCIEKINEVFNKKNEEISKLKKANMSDEEIKNMQNSMIKHEKDFEEFLSNTEEELIIPFINDEDFEGLRVSPNETEALEWVISK